MAGALTLGNGTTVTTLVLDGVLANIDSTVRKAAKRFNYTGDADNDAIATVTEFVVESIATDLDVKFSSQSKTDALQAANVDVAPISLPNPPATTV